MFLVFTGKYLLHHTPKFAISNYELGKITFWKFDSLLFQCIERGEAAFCSNCTQGLSPHKIPISSIFLHLFCHVTFSCWLRTFLLRSVAWLWFSTGSSYKGSGGYVTVEGGPLSIVSNCIHSSQYANFHCCVYLSHKGDVSWWDSLKKRRYEKKSCGNELKTAPLYAYWSCY